jgi:hypothetical protein
MFGNDCIPGMLAHSLAFLLQMGVGNLATTDDGNAKVIGFVADIPHRASEFYEYLSP